MTNEVDKMRLRFLMGEYEKAESAWYSYSWTEWRDPDKVSRCRQDKEKLLKLIAQFDVPEVFTFLQEKYDHARMAYHEYTETTWRDPDKASAWKQEMERLWELMMDSKARAQAISPQNAETPKFGRQPEGVTVVVQPSQQLPQQLVEREKTVIVKIRCRACHELYDESNDRCPRCGAR